MTAPLRTPAGLLNSGGVAVLKSSRITGTVPTYGYDDGGGIRNSDGGTLIVTNSVISGNEAVVNGRRHLQRRRLDGRH